MTSPFQPATISLTLRVWRQIGQPQTSGHPGWPSQDGARQVGDAQSGGFETHQLDNLSTNLSLLEALDLLNDRLVMAGQRPISFEHDCREGICGSCGFLVNGQAHGPRAATTVCQLYLRHFRDGDTLELEPWRAKAFPLLADLMVDRGGFDRIIAAGGYCSVNTGNAPEANAILIGKEQATSSFDAATCIGCGACVASCRHASASLFVAAKLAHLGQLPQGQPERARRARAMVDQMDAEGFGACSNHLECEAACPKEIAADWISWMRRELGRS
jgi:succinate dehydrogenase / fumarate reductase iron-sulfur subunit